MIKLKIGFIPAHREFFNEDWAEKMRDRSLNVLEMIPNTEIITPDKNLTRGGLVRNKQDASKVIELFKGRDVEAIIIGTMTFGDELAVLKIVEQFKNLPVFLFATKEGPFTSDGSRLSDSFCGTISIASGLKRRAIPFQFSGIIFPEESDFKLNIESFIRTANAVNSFKGASVGMVGPRPADFETCSINESMLIEKFGIKVVPTTLLDIYFRIKRIKDKDKKVRGIVEDYKSTCDCAAVTEKFLTKAAKLEIVLKEFVEYENLSCLAVQCWSAMEEIIEICPCSTFGRLTQLGIPTACETDIYGALTMMVQYKANFEDSPPHFMDWTIKHQEEDDTFMSFHCGNAPVSLSSYEKKPEIREHFLFDKVMGKDKSFGTCEFQLREGVMTFNRLSELSGNFKMLITKGNIQKDPRKLRGTWAWVKVKDLDNLYKTIIEEGFTHHASSIHADLTKEMENFCKFTGIQKVVI